MYEDKKFSGPTNCHNCNSENMIGPYKFTGPSVQFGIFNLLRTQAFVCVDCGNTMLFVRKGHEKKMMKEAIRRNNVSK
ncbi:MAG: hypothetical protein RTV41_02605 [Candidatus Thorarchaeota archaeon]